MYSAHVSTTGPYLGASLSSTGSSRTLVPPLPRSYQGTTTPCRPSRRASLPSFGGTTGALAISLPPSPSAAAAGLGLVTRYPRPGTLPWRRQDLPSSWGTPIPVCSCSPTPAGRTVPDHNGTVAWPPRRERRRRRQRQFFRGSIAWLSGSLPTYHVTVTRLTAQGSLPGAGQALPGRLNTRRAPTEGF
jgi:hypothetical protein